VPRPARTKVRREMRPLSVAIGNSSLCLVMAGLVPAIHVFSRRYD
jgi:hypothetical protein